MEIVPHGPASVPRYVLSAQTITVNHGDSARVNFAEPRPDHHGGRAGWLAGALADPFR